MTKKDYVLIASALSAERKMYPDPIDADVVLALDSFARRLAYGLSVDNPRFNTETFLIAAGVIPRPLTGQELAEQFNRSHGNPEPL